MANLVDRFQQWKGYECPYCKIAELEELLAKAAAEISDLQYGLALSRERRSLSAVERLHNICDALSEQADESPFTREEWNRVDEATALQLRRLRRLAQYIIVNLGGERRVPDHACVECFPDGEQIVDGFVCSYHIALQVIGAQKSGAEACR